MLFDEAEMVIALISRVCNNTDSLYWAFKVTQPSGRAFQKNWKWVPILSIEAWMPCPLPKLPVMKGANVGCWSEWTLQLPPALAHICAPPSWLPSLSGVFPKPTATEALSLVPVCSLSSLVLFPKPLGEARGPISCPILLPCLRTLDGMSQALPKFPVKSWFWGASLCTARC